MAVLRRLMLVALCAGLLSGIFATAAHQIATVPVILKAETYEKAAEHATAEVHHHTAAWEPESEAERAAYTLLADCLDRDRVCSAACCGAHAARRRGHLARRALLGLAGFATFTIAPGLGLPPEVPGTEAAPLLERQFWWLATVVSTGSALALLAFTRRAPWAILAAILIVLPYLYGAPQPTEHSAVAPETLARQFVVAVTVVNFLFWLILGAFTGFFYRRFQPWIGSRASAST